VNPSLPTQVSSLTPTYFMDFLLFTETVRFLGLDLDKPLCMRTVWQLGMKREHSLNVLRILTVTSCGADRMALLLSHLF
jgi:hypothetical protein